MNEAVIKAAEDFGFSEIMPPDAMPEDRDWHAIVTGQMQGNRKSGETLRIHVAFYDKGAWRLDDDQKIECLAWDKAVRMECAHGKPIRNSGGAADLLEAIGRDAAKEYLSAYKREQKSKAALQCAIAAQDAAIRRMQEDSEEMVAMITYGHRGGWTVWCSQQIRACEEARKDLAKRKMRLREAEIMFPDWLLMGVDKKSVFRSLQAKVKKGDSRKWKRRFVKA
jgi:hypothetical protein